jgi:uncharacterized protein YjbI with pentapeptide repeats
MMGKRAGIPVKRPQSIGVKPVKVNIRLLQALFNLVKDAAMQRWDKAPLDIMEIFSGIQLKDDTGERGWVLISRSLMAAMLNLIEENKGIVQIEGYVTDELDKKFNDLLVEEDILLGPDFFKRPADLPLIEKVKPIFADFLTLLKFEPAVAQNICNRLPAYFTFALSDEWRKKAGYYREWEQTIETPFDEIDAQEREWLLYFAWLQKQVDEPMFAETFGLRQVYVPLRAYYREREKEEAGEKEYRGQISEQKYKKVVVDMETALEEWLERGAKDDAIRVVSGGPGYGKSAFLKMFAARLADRSQRVLYIPLHRFEVKDDLKDAIGNFVDYNEYISFDPLDEEQLLLIFDGLDELFMQGKVLADVANQFIREVKIKVGNFNHDRRRIRVLLSGRDVIVQANESEFRKDRQVLHILPYYLGEDERDEFTDNDNRLGADQRDEWWQNYAGVKGKGYKGMPGELRGEEMDEITAQPLLNYLVSLSFERGQIDFSRTANLNEIYGDLLAAVHDRGYDESGTLKPIEHLGFKDFSRVMEEIALCAWHGDSRTTTVDAIVGQCRQSGLDRLFDQFKREVKKGIVSLLTAFYFRRATQTGGGDETFEFTHKSFSEFLTARRICNKLKQVHKKLSEHEKDFEEGWSIKDCLHEWIKIFGPREIDRDLHKFIHNEIELEFKQDEDNVRAIQQTLIRLIDHMLRRGMPLEMLADRPAYSIENRQAVNCEKALLIMLGTVSGFTKKISNIDWPSDTAFGELLSRLQGQRTDWDVFILEFLHFLDIKNSILIIKDLFGANLRGSNLSASKLLFANLRRANLRGADLRKADLWEADLRGADLREADLRGANLRGADLRAADLRGANLREANLEGVNLEGVNLEGVNLRRAHLMGANLRYCKITKRQLKEALVDEKTILPRNIKLEDIE